MKLKIKEYDDLLKNKKEEEQDLGLLQELIFL